jgi:hypothetical protein
MVFFVKYGVLNNIYKNIGVHLRKDTIMNQFHIHDIYIIGLIFKAQINLMRF